MSGPKAAWQATWKILLFLLAWGLAYAPAIPLVLGTGDGDGGIDPPTRVLLEIFGAAAVVLALWLLARFVDRRDLRSFGFRSGGLGRDVAAGLALGTAMIGAAVAMLWLAGWARPVPVTGFSWATLAMMGAAMLFNSITQEVMVRGYVLQTIEGVSNTTVAVVVSSAVFTALHAGAIAEGGALPALNLFAAGILLALAYICTRNLWLPIALHFAWNFLQGPVLGIAVSGQPIDGGWRMLQIDGPPLLAGGQFGLEGGLIGTVATLLGIAVLAVPARGAGRGKST